MRKFALVLVTVILAGIAATVALAAPRRPNLTLARAAGLAPASPGHPQGVRISASFGYQGLSPAEQPMLTNIDIWFPKGSVYNGAHEPRCSAHTLRAAGPSACPKASIMGSGGGNAFADTVITHPKITIVNGGPNVAYFYTVLNNPARVQDPVPGVITGCTATTPTTSTSRSPRTSASWPVCRSSSPCCTSSPGAASGWS